MKKTSWLFIRVVAIILFATNIVASQRPSIDDEIDDVAKKHRQQGSGMPESFLPFLFWGIDEVSRALPSSVAVSQLLNDKGLQECDPAFRQQMFDCNESFNQLKSLMKISDDVALHFNFGVDKNDKHVINSPAFAIYDSLSRKVYIFSVLFDLFPSLQMFTLMHELQHALQHQRSGLFANRINAIHAHCEMEHDADMAAACMMQCSVCLKMLSAFRKVNPTDHLGYLSSKELAEISQEKAQGALCCAYQQRDLQFDVQLAAVSTPLELFEVVQKDFRKNPSLKDRLPL